MSAMGKCMMVLMLLGLAGQATAGESAVLPASPYAAELKGRALRDLSTEFYASLPFLPPGLRFVGAYDLDPPDKMPPIPVPVRYDPYAVLPDGRVVKLAAVTDFARLGLHVQSGGQALQLARFVTDASTMKGGVLLQLAGSAMAEIPASGPCHHLRYSELGTELIYQVSLEEVMGKDKRKSFVIKRFMLPNPDGALSFFNTGGAYLLHTRETVGEDGSYSLATEQVPHSRIIIDRCFLR